MFGKEKYSQRLRELLDPLEISLKENDSLHNIKKAYDTLGAFKKHEATLTEELTLSNPLLILENMFYIKAAETASQKYPTLEDKYKELLVLKDMLSSIPVRNNAQRGLVSNIHNRILGLKNALTIPKSAS